MRMLTAFLRKEFLESARTYKLFILLIVFLLFGIMNPVMAKMTPDILKTFMPEGMNITIPIPTALDSWGQFFKNVSQMGLIIVIIIFSGIVSNEFSKGTLINILTKGLSRYVVLLAKFIAAFVMWTGSYLLCFAVSYFYTGYFWSMENVHNLFLAVAGLWMFGVLLIGILILGGTISKNNYGGLFFTFGFVAVMIILGALPALQRFNPISLVSQNMGLLTGQVKVVDFYPSMIVSAGVMVISVVAAIISFNKKRI